MTLRGQELADAVIEHVLMHPEQHDQDAIMTWDGVGCIAGLIVLLGTGSNAHIASASRHAAELLGVNEHDFYNMVFLCSREDEAIANLKELMSEATVTKAAPTP